MVSIDTPNFLLELLLDKFFEKYSAIAEFILLILKSLYGVGQPRLRVRRFRHLSETVELQWTFLHPVQRAFASGVALAGGCRSGWVDWLQS